MHILGVNLLRAMRQKDNAPLYRRSWLAVSRQNGCRRNHNNWPCSRSSATGVDRCTRGRRVRGSANAGCPKQPMGRGLKVIGRLPLNRIGTIAHTGNTAAAAMPSPARGVLRSAFIKCLPRRIRCGHQPFQSRRTNNVHGLVGFDERDLIQAEGGLPTGVSEGPTMHT